MPVTAKEKHSDQLLKIGEVARRTGVTLRTIRYYQSLGLIEPAHRSRGGLHLYRAETCDRIQFIRDMRSLDVPLAAIRDLLDQRKRAATGAEGARGVSASLTRGLAEVEKRMQQYLMLRHEMTEALEVLETCLRCSVTPSRVVCYACENLTRRQQVPAYIRALVN
ncbi:MAG: MerR family transcriptional regulator [candidate division NC10 bacterium]|nr:MerR family transcriptional regulator [candidate division NC10 bacterium]MBI2114198.1 MerR family transcriptional regulator [candidate division NC10 bacterium]MBI2454751.1 MerR family transcriptional regulator [candidate division NC10 bacterium]MBI2562097.1 MerR family transcriptional regulator [candidate division NC10 bacterium]MBI3087253.1 MerR family transcriptional regulator [candidate division NC10 bacterium]